MKQQTIILVTGPTASGKTALALQLARQHKTSIISADSRQCYREMNIGVAKPLPGELDEIKHYFINSHSIHDTVNAMTFAEYAHRAASEIFEDNDVAIMAGGTGLYIQAFFDGLDDIPETPADIRSQVIHDYKKNGLQWLQEKVRRKDPLFYAEGEIMNPQRLMRALEVILSTGRSIRAFQNHSNAVKRDDPVYNVQKMPIDLPREELYNNINQRVDRMMEQGLLDEVKSLLPYRTLNALQTVGYTELFDHLDGKMTLPEAVEKIKQHTRNYAKRQMTWARKLKT